jgi:NADPH:quinone reductase-like Zn-dependent oxidoreductase
MVAAMPIHGCYAQYVCLPQRKLVPVPEGLNAGEAVAVVLSPRIRCCIDRRRHGLDSAC